MKTTEILYHQVLRDEIAQIKSNIELCFTDLQKRVKSVQMMIYSSEIMRTLMMDLLDLAQMENSTFKLNKSYFNMSDVFKCAFAVIQHVADTKNVYLELAPISDQEKTYYDQIYGDRSRFLQVIINFLSNALKFSNKDSKVVAHLKILEN